MKKITFAIIALILVSMISKAQRIPNAGFENWTNMGSYNNIDSWSCLNPVTSGAGTYTCEKGTPGNSGNSYLKLTSKTVGANVVPGIAVCGTMDALTFQPKSGFPYADRPKALSGKWQHMIFGSSQGFIDVKLTRWDNNSKTRVLVASAHNVLSGMAMSWASFSIPITYSDPGAPDSCIIVMSASGMTPANQDYLWVDNLAFSGGSSVTEINHFDADINIFPNPTKSKLNIDLSSINSQKVSLQIYDIQGRLVKTAESTVEASNSELDISDLLRGTYLLKIVAQEGLITKKFIKE